MATPQSILDKIAIIKDKRAALVRLLDQPNLGTLRIDVNQALEEIDDLLDELAKPFPMRPSPPPAIAPASGSAAGSASPLARLETFLQEQVTPQAAEIDQSPEALAAALAGLGARSLLTLRLPQAWGGQALNSLDYWQAQRHLARASGSLAFLQTQHQSAASLIAQGDNEALKQAHLPLMAQGQRLVGVGFSHLRRGGVPCLRAVPVAEGYRLQGEIPWATGWEYFSHLVAGATINESEHLLCLIPFGNCSGDRLQCSVPMALAAFGVTQTVAIRLQDWWVPRDQVIAQRPSDWLQHSDRQHVLKATAFLIGCAEAALEVMGQYVIHQQLAKTERVWQALSQELQTCQANILRAIAAAAPFEQQLRWRAEAIALCHRCTQAAVIASGGAANLLGHPAQRLYREALVYSVTGQTAVLKAASLEALSLGPSVDNASELDDELEPQARLSSTSNDL